MQTLIDILNHPYVIENRVAEDLYPDEPSGVAIFERLRSRIRKRHHFTKAEYQQLRELFRRWADKLDRVPGRMARSHEIRGQRAVLYKDLPQGWLNRKALIADAGQKLDMDYNRLYDQLRGRTLVSEASLDALTETISAYTAELRSQLDALKVERKSYQFSMGPGGRGYGKE